MDTKWKTNEETASEEMDKPGRKERKQKNVMKRSKKIKAFIYRILAAGAFFTMIFSGIMGREALNNLYRMGDKALTGDIRYLVEFREYMTTLCQEALIGYAGAGDDNGFPLTDEKAIELSKNNIAEFHASSKYGKDDLLYHIDEKGVLLESNGISYPLFSETDGHLLLPEDITLCIYWNGPDNTLTFFDTRYSLDYPVNIFNLYAPKQYLPNMEKASDIRLLLAVQNTDSFQSFTFFDFQKRADCYQLVLFVFFGSMALFLTAGFFCLLSHRTAKQMWQDFAEISLKLWLECKVLLMAGSIYLCYYFTLWDLHYPFAYRAEFYPYIWLYLPTGIVLYLFCKDIRYNRCEVWKHSLTGSLIRFVLEYLTGTKWYRKTLLMCSTSLLCSLLLFCLGILLQVAASVSYINDNSRYFAVAAAWVSCLAGILLFFVSLHLKRFSRDTNTLCSKLSELHEGSERTPVVLPAKSLLSQAAEDLNALEEGIEAAIEQQNRSNKMRVELITNVSHDLKTPLTSIINYADLLCEEPLSAPASEYASALQAKAYRLKSMVQDVFELSKATSGNLPVEKTVLDLAKLTRQTLADMEERISASTLTFKLFIATEPIFIEADGEKLYRIFQNLIVNALQYSLEHSRVHVQLSTEGGYAYAKLKNTSKEELTFDTEEIMERFVRADSSRTTEGSGLGLSIVQSFTEACGGSFCITTDADMFTACVSFPLAQAPEVCPIDPICTQRNDEHENREKEPIKHTERKESP